MVNVIGLGYIGLPTALMLATHGVSVVGTDCNTELVRQMQSGQIVSTEKGMWELFQTAKACGIQFSQEYQVADTYIVSVPTPYNEKRKVDVCYLVPAIESVLEVCPKGATVVIESTVPPGTIDAHIRPVIEARGYVPGRDIHLAHAPERIIPGNMLEELLTNNRTIGADEPEVGNKIKELYASFCRGEIIVTDIRTAEMTKVVENTYRAVNIAFANELAKVCHSAGLDVYDVIRICNMHPRVNILQPGPGVGGHCISVDPWFLVGDYPESTRVTAAAMETNMAMPGYVLHRILEIMEAQGIWDIKKVGLYGLAYKANVDDCRESPTLQLQKLIRERYGVELYSYDPYVKTKIAEEQMFDRSAFFAAVDMVVVMVGHNEICCQRGLLDGKQVLDCCNLKALDGAYHL